LSWKYQPGFDVETRIIALDAMVTTATVQSYRRFLRNV
jgi:hypothetical protein